MKPKDYEVIYKFTVAPTVPFPSALNWSTEPIGELIRCKDCRWYAYKYDGYHSECDLFKMCFDPDDYCSRAERKEE